MRNYKFFYCFLPYHMFLSVHSVAATTLAQSSLPTGMVFLLSFLSHFALDIIPHGDENILPKIKAKKHKIKSMITIAIIDSGVIFVSLLALKKLGIEVLSWRILGAIFFATLPDGLQFLEYVTDGKIKLIHIQQKLHRYIHNISGFTVPFWLGMIVQLLFFSAFILFLV